MATTSPPTEGAQLNLSADTTLTNTLAALEAEKWLATNSVSSAGQTNSTAELLPIGAGMDTGSADPFGTSIFGLAAPDLLNVTPQMLAAYFHPVVRGTNVAAAVVVPVPVIFAPPQTRARPASRADYIVK